MNDLSQPPQPEQWQVPPPRVSQQRAARRLPALLFIAGSLVLWAAKSGALEKAWEVLSGHQISLEGEPVPATHSKLSEHQKEWIQHQAPQKQMEALLEAAINHDLGATDMIAQLVEGWRGSLHNTHKYQTLEMTALYSNDLRVRAAAIEINLAAYEVPKTSAEIDMLWRAGERDVKSRPGNAWVMGMLANRGVESDRVRELLEGWAHDADQQSRFWAVEGLAHIGTDDTIKNFLDVLKNDTSLEVRERAGCSLAKSGMLTREQRMKAVPGLLDMSDDRSLDSTTRSWVYQALREITDINLPNDPAAWRNWYSEHGAEQARKFHQAGDAVLGNS